MRCQVVLSGLDSRESVTIQQDLHFPIVLPSRNSYGTTIIDGLINVFTTWGGTWCAVLDAHTEATLRYIYKLYEHDDKTVGDMDDMTLHNLSFVEIDD